MVAAVGSIDIGDIPDGICASAIEHRATAEGVGIAAHVLGAVALERIGVITLPRVGPLVPEGGIEGDVGRLGLPLCRDGVVGDSIEEARAVDTDGRFEAHVDIVGIFLGGNLHIHTVALHIDGRIIGRVGNSYLGISQFVGFAIVKAVAPFVGIGFPVNLDLRLVDGCLEGFDGCRLWHARHRANVGVGLLVVDDEEVAVAVLVGRVTILARAVAVAGMAIAAARTYIDRAQTAECAFGILVEIILKEVLAFVESRHHARTLNGGSGLLESHGGVVGRCAQASASEVVLGIVKGCAFANLPTEGFAHVVGAGGEQGGRTDGEERA